MAATEHDVSFARLRELVRAHAVVTPTSRVALAAALGATLAAPVTARADHPGFDNSAMDGWAVRAADTPGRLAVEGEAAAGRPAATPLAAGAAARIATGAPLPGGADAIVPVERAREEGASVVVERAEPGAFVRRAGEDLRAGTVVLEAGTVLGAHHLGAAAAAGAAALEVRGRPRVRLILSGDEVVPPGSRLAPGQVWDVAGVALPAAVAVAGGEVASVIHLADDRAASEAALAEAAADADAVITVGGISKGAHDHVRPALDALGAEVVVAGAAIRPGHPVRLARLGGTPVLALPGNPVSAVVCMTLFGRVLLGRDDVLTALPLAAAHRAGTPRTDLIRCALGPDGLVPAARQASHDVSGLAGATHLAVRPPEPERLEPGATLETLRMP